MFPVKVAGIMLVKGGVNPGLQPPETTMNYVSTCEVNLPFLISTEIIA